MVAVRARWVAAATEVRRAGRSAATAEVAIGLVEAAAKAVVVVVVMVAVVTVAVVVVWWGVGRSEVVGDGRARVEAGEWARDEW